MSVYTAFIQLAPFLHLHTEPPLMSSTEVKT